MTNLREHALETEYGLDTEPAKHVHRLLNDYDPYLSLRRVPEGDPAFKPGERQFGVWEETSTASTKWAFIVPEISLGNPGGILARVVLGDATKRTPAERMQALQAAHAAAELARQKQAAEQAAERREMMLYIASTPKSSIRHKIDGEDLIISDHARSVRQFIV